jgi:dipeptidyl aminopeptidase/acylaminoacyl peptidase
MPVWAFHGRLDTVVPFEETERIVQRLEGRNRNLRFSAEPDIGHSIHWQVYPGHEIYDWLLRYDRKSRLATTRPLSVTSSRAPERARLR